MDLENLFERSVRSEKGRSFLTLSCVTNQTNYYCNKLVGGLLCLE